MVTGPAQPALATRVVETLDDLYGLRSTWQSVFAAGQSSNPFARWEWTYHWWRVFGRIDGPLRDRLHILVHDDAQGNTQGITPLVRTGFHYGPLNITKLRNAGAVPGAYITEMYPYIWSRDYEVPVARSLANELYRGRGEYLWAEIDTVPLDRPFGHELAASYLGTRGLWQAPTPYFPVVLPDTWAELKAKLTRNAREYLRQTDVRLARLTSSGHHCAFELLSTPHEVMGGLEEFFKLHTARSIMVPNARDPHYHPDHFASENTRQFLRAVAGDLAAQPHTPVSIVRLRIDGQTVACRILLTANDELFLFYSGFDPRWKDSSVMSSVTARCVRHAIESPEIRVLNLSTHMDRSKLQWKPEEGHLLGNIRLQASTVGGRVAGLVSSNVVLLRGLAAGLGRRTVA